jgi:hypothetical protein
MLYGSRRGFSRTLSSHHRTLTAASKMFLLEPFSKYEEEKQAYSRLHRYGQTKDVHCKVYFTPVSVEYRLLEWRKRVSVPAPTDGHILYAPMRNDVTVDAWEEEEEEEEEHRFLLGIDHQNVSASTETYSDDFSD